MQQLDHPQWALVGSLVGYPALYLASLPPHPSFRRIVQSREALSIFHVTLQSILSSLCLYHHKDALTIPEAKERGKSQFDPYPPVIATRSVFAQSITAIEAGYLLQDSFVLLHAYQNRSNSGARAVRVKGWSFVHLGIHHVILGGLMLILQYHIAQKREKGILVIIALHLMNASSIFGTIRWFLINFHPGNRKMILTTTAMYLSVFALFRLYNIAWIMRIYAKQRGPTVLAAMKALPFACKLGTGTIFAVNALWLINGTKDLALRIANHKKSD